MCNTTEHNVVYERTEQKSGCLFSEFLCGFVCKAHTLTHTQAHTYKAHTHAYTHKHTIKYDSFPTLICVVCEICMMI